MPVAPTKLLPRWRRKRSASSKPGLRPIPAWATALAAIPAGHTSPDNNISPGTIVNHPQPPDPQGRPDQPRGRRRQSPGLPPKQGLLRSLVRARRLRGRFCGRYQGTEVAPNPAAGDQVLKNLDHRGASGSEANTGDGAGVLLQMPHAFLAEVCKKSRIALPGPSSTAAVSSSCRAIPRIAAGWRNASSRSCSPRGKPSSAGGPCPPTALRW